MYAAAMPSEHSPLQPLVGRLERLAALDAPAKAVGKQVRALLKPGAVKDAVSGTWLGHALHPLLTDVVIGSFVSATLLDLLGGDDDGRAAQRLIGVGIAAYGPTALSGISDWADTEVADDRVRRVGVTHATTNAAALSLFTASLAARRAGNDGRGKALSLAGTALLAAAGYLGAHMTYAQGVGANQTAFDRGPDDWGEVSGADGLAPGQPASGLLGETPLLLVRHGSEVHALHDRCSHRGCLLSDGEVEGETVTCGCHGSQFDLRDGSVQRGPATVPQPAYDVRERDGRIEARLRADS